MKAISKYYECVPVGRFIDASKCFQVTDWKQRTWDCKEVMVGSPKLIGVALKWVRLTVLGLSELRQKLSEQLI